MLEIAPVTRDAMLSPIGFALLMRFVMHYAARNAYNDPDEEQVGELMQSVLRAVYWERADERKFIRIPPSDVERMHDWVISAIDGARMLGLTD